MWNPAKLGIQVLNRRYFKVVPELEIQANDLRFAKDATVMDIQKQYSVVTNWFYFLKFLSIRTKLLF